MFRSNVKNLQATTTKKAAAKKKKIQYTSKLRDERNKS